MTDREVEVSVVCITYNHEKYIRNALEGFVAQQTDFCFEVIVHDDASSDDTTQIVREYERKYPEIIKPIYQTINQYGKGTMYPRFIIPKLKGKYVALCEGDDYWIDNQKLQKQYDYMENNPSCSFCFTNAIIENQDNMEKRPFIPYRDSDKKHFDLNKVDYDLHDFYYLSFIPTASFFMKKEDFLNVFEMYKKPCPTGDLKYRLYTTAQGYAHFINTPTCVYRENVPSSAMSKWKESGSRDAYYRDKQIYDMLKNLDEMTERRFHDGLIHFMAKHSSWMFVDYNLRHLFGNHDLQEMFLLQKMKMKIKMLVKLIIPKSVFLFAWSLRK